jgi:hypothetical protein
MVERILNRLLKHRVILNCDRDPYLHRWYLWQSDKIGIYIHKFVRSDEDRALHDHPWPFVVIPIWRGYIEHNERDCDCFRCKCTNPSGPAPHGFAYHKSRVLPILGTRIRPATYRHRVELLRAYDSVVVYDDGKGGQIIQHQPRELPAWSIFIRFKRVREWGFWPAEGFIQWNKWWNEKCE